MGRPVFPKPVGPTWDLGSNPRGVGEEGGVGVGPGGEGGGVSSTSREGEGGGGAVDDRGGTGRFGGRGTRDLP